MLRIMRAARRAAEASERGPQLGRSAIVACLIEFGPQSQADVCRRLEWDPSDAVALVDALEDDEYVVRRRDKTDRRRYALEVTGDGRAWFDRLVSNAREGQAALLGGLDPSEREVFVDMLRRVLAHLDDRVPIDRSAD
jgi:DNA-binding MarR family transcriptional regulator